MRKLILMIGITLLFYSCRNKNTSERKINAEKVVDTLAYTYDSVKVFSKNIIKKENNINDTTNALIKYPIFKNSSLNTFIERKVTDYIGENEELVSYNYLAASFINGYDDFFKNNKETFQSWFLVIDIQVINQYKNYVAIQYLHSDYSGGAHPNTNITFLNYNLENNQTITLDSLIEENQKYRLNQIGESIFRKNERLSANANLDADYFFENGKFNLPENFYISKKGIVFLYNPYEIKPYVAGITELVIPFSKLTNIIKPNTILSIRN